MYNCNCIFVYTISRTCDTAVADTVALHIYSSLSLLQGSRRSCCRRRSAQIPESNYLIFLSLAFQALSSINLDTICFISDLGYLIANQYGEQQKRKLSVSATICQNTICPIPKNFLSPWTGRELSHNSIIISSIFYHKSLRYELPSIKNMCGQRGCIYVGYVCVFVCPFQSQNSPSVYMDCVNFNDLA